MGLKKLVAGNWKMHGLSSDLDEVRAIAAASADYPGVDVALCVPAILIERAARAVPGFAIGGQDVHHAGKGAHTGCTSVLMLLDAGASLTIVGHSERRDAQRESDEEVKAKAEAALSVGLNVILCVGESLDVRKSGGAVATVAAQLDGSLPDSPRRGRARDCLRADLGDRYGQDPDDCRNRRDARVDPWPAADRYGADGRNVRILYGGSVKASNAAEIFAIADVDGALVGGASLKAADFLPIIAAAAAVEG